MSEARIVLGYGIATRTNEMFEFADGHWHWMKPRVGGMAVTDYTEMRRRLIYARQDADSGRIKSDPRVVKVSVLLEDEELPDQLDQAARAILRGLTDVEREILSEFFERAPKDEGRGR